MNLVTLTVEDELPGEVQLEKLLSPHIKTASATTVQEALAAIQQNPDISLVVMDLFLSETPREMPWFDKGLKLVQDIRKLRPEIPIIIVSSLFGEESARIAAKYGVAGVFSKHDAEHKLVNSIQKLVSKHTAQEWRQATPISDARAPSPSQLLKTDQAYIVLPHQDAFFGEIRDALIDRNLATHPTAGSRSAVGPLPLLRKQHNLKEDDDFKARVFLSYAREDRSYASALYDRLKTDGFDPWLDEKHLLPGQNWRNEVVQAMRSSDTVLVLLSPRSVNKTGFVQKEIVIALDILKEHPYGSSFVIPVKLEECLIPLSLQDFHSVDLFDPEGYNLVLRSLRTHIRRGARL